MALEKNQMNPTKTPSMEMLSGMACWTALLWRQILKRMDVIYNQEKKMAWNMKKIHVDMTHYYKMELLVWRSTGLISVSQITKNQMLWKLKSAVLGVVMRTEQQRLLKTGPKGGLYQIQEISPCRKMHRRCQQTLHQNPEHPNVVDYEGRTRLSPLATYHYGAVGWNTLPS